MNICYVCNRGKDCRTSPSCWKECFYTLEQKYALYKNHVEFQLIRKDHAQEYLTDEEMGKKPFPGEIREGNVDRYYETLEITRKILEEMQET